MIAACLLLTYGHYLGPIGMPDSDLRVLAQDPPPGDFHWLSYTDEFLVMGPILSLLVVAVFLAASRWHGHRWEPLELSPRALGVSMVALLAVVAAGVLTAQQVQSADRTVTVSSQGAAFAQAGADVFGEMAPVEGQLRCVAGQQHPASAVCDCLPGQRPSSSRRTIQRSRNC